MFRRLRLLPMLALAGVTIAAEPLSFYVNYSQQVPSAPLAIHPLSIVHPDATVDLAAAHRVGSKVLAYLSVGEIAADAPYRAEAVRRGLPFAGHNETWNSDLLDLADARWATFLADEIAATAAARGFDGFFLDTLDSVQLVARTDAAHNAAAKTGLVALVRRLHSNYPRAQIVINRGFFIFDEVREVIDGVLAESLFETRDFAAKKYRQVALAESDALLAALKKISAAGRAVYVLDYVDPADATRATADAQQIQALGFHAFVSTPALDGAMLAPLRPVARRICAFYGNLTPVQEDQVKWPAESFVAQRLQLPLEWLGYEVDYFKIIAASDLPQLGADCRAIVIPRSWEIPQAVEPALVDWLLAQRTTGRKILIFGNLPFRDREQRDRFMREFGLAGDGGFTSPPFRPQLIVNDKTVLGYEEPVTALPVGHRNLRAPANARRLLSIQATVKDGPPVNFDAVFTCAWGGMAFDPYLFFRRADFREFWHLDPFAFLTLALGEFGAPAPDTTTRDGRRLFLNHIDGDGFANVSRVDAGRRSAEVIRDHILKKYPLPVTVSVIEAEVRALIRNQPDADASKLEAIARDVFALPQVELASHSFSHPFFWIAGDRTEAFYDEQRLELKAAYPALDLAREIEGSVRYINDTLAPPGRPVRVFLWSGNCRPPPEAIALTRRLGLENLNGGDTLITARNQTLTAVAPRTMPWGDELQILAPNQNENVYTNNWRGPLFGTFTHVLDTYALTESPRRLKPINLYYHFYSGDYPASVQALETIYDWLMVQSIHAVAVSHYARIARDARATALFTAGPKRWIAVNHGDSRTLRLSAALAPRIDFAQSAGVTGWKIETDQAYIHTDGSPVVTIALGEKTFVGPRLESSSAEINFLQHGPSSCHFTVADLRDVEVVFAGVAPLVPVPTAINGVQRTATADAGGRLTLSLPAHADVALTFTQP